MKKRTKTFKVKITKKGSEDAKPAIWYAGKAEQEFIVERSQQYPCFYEVSKGDFSGKIIDPKDCILITEPKLK